MKSLKSVVIGLALAVGIILIPILVTQAADQPAAPPAPAAPAPAAPAPVAPAPAVAKEVVNINTATVDQLALLKGIGPKLAKAIVDHRTKMGNFKAVEDLKMIKGISDKLLAKIKDKIVLEGETTMKAAEKAAPKKKATVKKEKVPAAPAPAAPNK